MNSKKNQWNELSPGNKRLVTGAGVVQLVLLVLAQRDISRKSAAQIRGPKGVWRVVSLINFFGPLAYFAFGRRKNPRA